MFHTADPLTRERIQELTPRGVGGARACVLRGSLLLGQARRPAYAPVVDESNARIEGTVLIADDEKQLVRLLARFFERAGYRVYFAHDGDRAVELFGEHRDEIDAVFLDVVIPPRGVRDVVERIREMRDAVGIVLTSGDDLDPSLRGQLETWKALFLRKPYASEAPLRAVSQVLESRSAENGA
jgi:CheY-like chemotaxis protein